MTTAAQRTPTPFAGLLSWFYNPSRRRRTSPPRFGCGLPGGRRVRPARGASLQPTETRTHALLGGVANGWLILIAAVTVLVLRVHSRPRQRSRKPPRT
jgi:hypothetical protein